MEQTRETGRTLWVGVIAVSIVFGISIRWFDLAGESLWFDEGYTAWVVTQPVFQILRAISVDTSPPLYYLLLKGWTEVFGHGEAALRSMSAAMGTISLLTIYAISRRMFRDGWAVAAAVGLSSVSLLQIRYAQEARFYEMTGLVVAVLWWLVLRYLQDRRRSTFVAITQVMTAGLYTNNVMFFYLAAVGVAWVMWPMAGAVTWRRRARDVVTASAVAGALYLLWVPIFWYQLQRVEADFWTATPAWRDLVIVTASVFGVGDNAAAWAVRTIVWLALGVVAIGIFAACRSSRGSREASGEEPSPPPSPGTPGEGVMSIVALVVMAMGPVVVAYVYSLIRQSIFMERIFVASAVMTPLLIGACVERARGRLRWLAIGIAGVMGVMSVCSTVYFFRGPHKEAWRDAVADVMERPSRRQLIVFVANEGELLFDYYAARHEGPRHLPEKIGAPRGFFELDPPRTMQRVMSDDDVAELAEKLASRRFLRVTLVMSHVEWSDPRGRVMALLDGKLRRVSTREFPGVMVVEFAGASRGTDEQQRP